MELFFSFCFWCFFTLLLLYSPVEAQQILFENDFFAVGQKDRFLTNHTVINYRSFSVGNEMYTPTEKENPLIPDGDRPWDGYSYVGYTAIRGASANEARYYTVRLGAVGDLSATKNLQRFVHNDLGLGADPTGWETANPSEITIDGIYEHKFKSRFKSWVGDAVLLQTYGVRAGTVRVSCFLEQEARRGFWLENDLAFFVFAGVRGEVKAYDTHLDGRLFRSNHYTVRAIPFVAWANAGAEIVYKNYFLRYGYKFQTEEFKNQDGRHLYGSISLGAIF